MPRRRALFLYRRVIRGLAGRERWSRPRPAEHDYPLPAGLPSCAESRSPQPLVLLFCSVLRFPVPLPPAAGGVQKCHTVAQRVQSECQNERMTNNRNGFRDLLTHEKAHTDVMSPAIELPFYRDSCGAHLHV